jgi:AbiJ N-terminal domain 4
MAIWDLFSKRERRKRRQGQDDVFQYDNLPKEFRVQVIHLWVDGLGCWYDQPMYGPPRTNLWWTEIIKIITREKGVFHLGRRTDNPFIQCQHYLQDASTEEALDLIEVTFRLIDRVARPLDWHEREQYELKDPDQVYTLLPRFIVPSQSVLEFSNYLRKPRDAA